MGEVRDLGWKRRVYPCLEVDMERILTPQEQINGLNQIFQVLQALQNKLPGENYKVFEDLKNGIAQINNSIVEQSQPSKELNGKAEEVSGKELEDLASRIV